jgi:hypothetical protein
MAIWRGSACTVEERIVRALRGVIGRNRHWGTCETHRELGGVCRPDDLSYTNSQTPRTLAKRGEIVTRRLAVPRRLPNEQKLSASNDVGWVCDYRMQGARPMGKK